jgi:choline monooxygenase
MVIEVKKALAKDLSILKSVKSLDFANYLATWERQAPTKAVSFPSFMYTSEEVYKAERERFFSRAWIYIGHTSQLEGANSYFTTSIAGFPLVIAIDRHEVLHAFHNVCTHRAAPVAIGNGKCNRFVCPYHAWTFDLEGKLRGIPNFEGYEDFEPSEHNLKSVQKA